MTLSIAGGLLTTSISTLPCNSIAVNSSALHHTMSLRAMPRHCDTSPLVLAATYAPVLSTRHT